MHLHLPPPPPISNTVTSSVVEAPEAALVSVSLCSSQRPVWLSGLVFQCRDRSTVAQTQRQEKEWDAEKSAESLKLFWSLVCFHLCFGSYVRGGFGPEVCRIWRSQWAHWWFEMKRSRLPEPSRVLFLFFCGRATLGQEELCVGREKRKETKRLVLPASPSTCRKCSRTPAVLAPRSGSGRPCGPPCSRSPFQAAAAWGRTRWPRSGWSYGFPHRGRSLWRNKRERNHFNLSV